MEKELQLTQVSQWEGRIAVLPVLGGESTPAAYTGKSVGGRITVLPVLGAESTLAV